MVDTEGDEGEDDEEDDDDYCDDVVFLDAHFQGLGVCVWEVGCLGCVLGWEGEAGERGRLVQRFRLKLVRGSRLRISWAVRELGYYLLIELVGCSRNGCTGFSLTSKLHSNKQAATQTRLITPRE